jgi:hypothetical protein
MSVRANTKIEIAQRVTAETCGFTKIGAAGIIER